MFTATDHRSSVHAVVRVVVMVSVILSIGLLIFVWPAARLEPRDLPVGFVGSPEQAASFAQQAANRRGTLDVVIYENEAAAIDGIESRDVYGALVPGEQEMRVLIASAGSPMVAQLLGSLFPTANTQVVDVVPGTASDPRAAAFASALFPLIVTAMLAGFLTWRFLAGARERMVALAGSAIVSGMIAAGIVQSWLDLLGGSWLAIAGVYALAVFAIGTTIAGLTALWGPAGAALGGFLVIFVGNAYSGVTTAPELMPVPLGTIGQWLPPGSAGSLLRSTAFFNGADAAMPLAVLVLWSLVGVSALLAASLVRARSARKLEMSAEPAV